MAEPLKKKRRRDGKLYERPPSIEKLLDSALEEPPETIERRGNISEKTSPEYLPTECLLHLLRAAFRRKNIKLRDVVLPLVLKRCERLLENGISSRLRNAEYLRKIVLSKFGEMLAVDAGEPGHTELDYYECRFNSAFKTFRIDVLRGEKREAAAVSLPVDEEGKTAELAPGCLTGLFKSAGQVPSPETAVMHNELCEAVRALPDDERKAIVLHFDKGYKIESVDPNERTVASICKVSGKTIRTLDQCGVTLLAGKAVGAPFVGMAAAAMAVAEILRFLHGGPLYQLIDADLVAVEHRTVVPHPFDYSKFNPGFVAVR